MNNKNRVGRLLTFCCLCFWAIGVSAAASPQITAGLTWLHSQIAADGSLRNESLSLATSIQNRAEALATLESLEMGDSSLADALATTDWGATEYLARRIIVLSHSGRDTAALQTQLAALQNADGGFGGGSGYASDPLDTAWSLIALDASGLNDKVPAALSYLRLAQYVDGSYALTASGSGDLYASAMVLEALARYASSYSLTSNIQPLVSYLQAQRPLGGLWANSFFISAVVYEALHDFLPLNPTATEMSDLFVAAQGADGSWQTGDPYVTALVLRALSLTTVTPKNPTLGRLKGKVIDGQTGYVLEGVTISLSGPTNIAVTSGANGFEVADLDPGNYDIQLNLVDYGTLNTSTVISAGEEKDLGTLILSKPLSATTGTVLGTITDSSSGLPVSGAAVMLSTVSLPALTDSQGHYQFTNVPAGDVTLQIEAGGYASSSGRGTVPAGGVLVFSTTLATVADKDTQVTGTILDGVSGLPLAGVTVAVTGADTASTTTDALGHYSLKGLVAGSLQLSASLGGYDSVSAETTIALNTTILFSPKLYPSGSTPMGANTAGITGIVVDAGDNHPLSDTVVTLSMGTTQSTFTTGADGRFTFTDIATETVGLQFDQSGYQSSVLMAGLPPLETLDAGQIRLRKQTSPVLLPDLKVTATARGAAVTDPQNLTVAGALAVTVANIGTAVARGGYEILAFHDVNRDGVYQAGVDTEMGRIHEDGDIGIGQNVAINVPVTGELPFRDAPITVWVDSAQTMVELEEDNNVRSTASAAEVHPDIGTFKPVLKWAWTKGAVITTPIVGPLQDTNGDGLIDQRDVPAIIFTTHTRFPDHAPGVLHAISGADGHDLWAVTDPSLQVGAETTPALADIDGDGKPEVIDYLYNGSIAVFNGDGTLKWNAAYPPSPGYYNYGAPTIADLDGDGKSEIIARNYVLNYDGSLRWVGSASSPNHSVVTAVADLDMDGSPEVITGKAAYRADGSIYWNSSSLLDGRLAIANMDDDPYPEIISVYNQRLYLINHDGTIRWGPVLISGAYNGGAPTIADMDGDGVPDIGVAGAAYYTVFNNDGSVKWQSPVLDYSGITGSTVFDFDGNGQAEVVYFDQLLLRIYNGSTGQVDFSIPNHSVTASEYPVVADVDNDNHADIVVPGQYPGEGIRVFKDENNSWVNTRRIWNQYGYHITNINDDGSVPRHEQNSWQVDNTYRLNERPGISSTAVPDLTASYLRITDRGGVQPSSFTVRIGNAGGLPVDPGIDIAFYSGAPGGGGTLLGVAHTSKTLTADEYEDVTLKYSSALGGISELVAVADDDGSGGTQVDDFDRSNNSVSIPLTVQVSSLLLTVTTDQVLYGSQTPVVITPTIQNLGSFDSLANLRLSIESNDGVLVASLPSQNGIAIPSIDSVVTSGTWNTGLTLTDSYRVKAELVDDAGKSYAEAYASFDIVAATDASVAGRVAVDKINYQPYDTVNVTDRLLNLTDNQILEGLALVTAVWRPDGSSLWAQQTDVAQSLPGELKTLNYSVPLLSAPSGHYRVTLAVSDSAGTVLSASETAFDVLSTSATGMGLTGTVSASPHKLETGQDVIISSLVQNLGNTELFGLPLTLSIVDPSTQTVAFSKAYGVDLPQGGDQTLVTDWTAQAVEETTYVAVLQATIGGVAITLAQDNFTVIPPPIKLDFAQEIKQEARVLVLASCSGDDEATCCDTRGPFIDDLLNGFGIPHLVVSNEEQFRTELRGGRYNVYWLSGGSQKLDQQDLANEVRAAVYRGDTLFMDDMHDERNHLLDDVIGVESIGKLSGDTQNLTLNPPIFGAHALVSLGSPIRFTLKSGTAQGQFTSSDPAVISNDYGWGHALVMAFDLAGTLQGSADTAWSDVARNALRYLVPQVSAVYSGGGYMALHTFVTNLGQVTDVEVRTTVLPGGDFIPTNPAVTYSSTGQAIWDAFLSAQTTADYTLYLRLPQATGQYQIPNDLYSITNGVPHLYGSYPFGVTVEAQDQGTGALLITLQGLSLKGGDAAARRRAVNAINDAMTASGQGQEDDAINDWLEAYGQIERISSVATADLQRTLAILLQQAEYRWWLDWQSRTGTEQEDEEPAGNCSGDDSTELEPDDSDISASDVGALASGEDN